MIERINYQDIVEISWRLQGKIEFQWFDNGALFLINPRDTEAIQNMEKFLKFCGVNYRKSVNHDGRIRFWIPYEGV